MRERMRYVPVALGASGVLLVLAVAVGWLVAGGAGAAGAAGGVALVAGSYLVSGAAVAWADSVTPRLVLPVGLATYIGKVLLLGLVLLLIVRSGWDGTAAIGVAIIPAVLVWTGAQLWWTVRSARRDTSRTVAGHP